MKVDQLFAYLESVFPLQYQEHFDNSGPQVYFPDEEISNVLLALDIDRAVVQDARDRSCNVIVTHHPLLFKPVKNLVRGDPRSDIMIDMVDHRISLYSLHTNLDKFYYDRFARSLGFENGEVLIKTDTIEDPDRSKVIGFGMRARTSQGIILRDLLEQIKMNMNIDHLVFAGNLDQEIHTIAFINGAGGGFFNTILSDDTIDCIVTGDISYHHAMDALSMSVSVVDAGHYNTERILLYFLGNNIQDYLTNNDSSKDIMIAISDVEKNPLRIY